jgi:hypothetical protein
MEYRIGRQLDDKEKGESKIEMYQDLTEQEFNELQSALSKIEELHSIRRLRDFVTVNDEEIMTMLNVSLNDLVNKASFWADVKRKDIEEVFLNINRLLLNYLSSVKTFIDHTSTFLNRKFGKQSEELIRFKTMLSAFFDHSFAYRFLSKLRDYAQHVDLPLDEISFKSNRAQETNQIVGELTVAFNRDSLLNTFQKWGPVKSDLEQMDDFFNFTPLLFQMTQIIIEIECNVELIFKDELIEAATLISDSIVEIRNDGWETFLACDFKLDEAGKLKNFQQTWIPLDTVDFILTELN